MLWKKREFLRQRIKERLFGRDAGQITLCAGLFFTLFLSVLLVSQLQLEMARTSSAYLEDALAAAGLASALIDIREYGSSHTVSIPDARTAYRGYCVSLKENLGLNDNWEGNNQKLISGRVTIENYTVYNVVGRKVEIYTVDEKGVHLSKGVLGRVNAPNGQVVTHTGVYSEISYPFQGLFGMSVTARKGKLVDIVGKDS